VAAAGPIFKTKEEIFLPKTTITSLLTKIGFSPDRVVDAAAENAVLFVEAIHFRLECLEASTNAKMEWEKSRAERSLEIRKDARDNGVKTTEDGIAALLLTDKRVSGLDLACAKADIQEEYSKLVVEAFRMRRDCLKIVGEMTRDEIGLQRSAEAGAEKAAELRRKMKEKFPGE